MGASKTQSESLQPDKTVYYENWIHYQKIIVFPESVQITTQRCHISPKSWIFRKRRILNALPPIELTLLRLLQAHKHRYWGWFETSYRKNLDSRYFGDLSASFTFSLGTRNDTNSWFCMKSLPWRPGDGQISWFFRHFVNSCFVRKCRAAWEVTKNRKCPFFSDNFLKWCPLIMFSSP